MPPELAQHIHHIEHLMHHGDTAAAIEKANELLKDHPGNYHLISMLGECYLNNGEPEKAIKPLLWAVEHSEESELLIDEGESTEEEDEDILVGRLWSTFDEKNSGPWVDHFLLGCAYARTQDFDRGLQYLEKANAMNPNHGDITRNIGWVMCMTGNLETGRKHLSKSIELDRHNPLSYHDMAASFLFEGKLLEAKMWMDKAIQLDPYDPLIQTTSDKLDELWAHFTLFGLKAKVTPEDYL